MPGATPARCDWERARAGVCGVSWCPWQLQWQRRIRVCVLVVQYRQEGWRESRGGGSLPREEGRARAG